MLTADNSVNSRMHMPRQASRHQGCAAGDLSAERCCFPRRNGNAAPVGPFAGRKLWEGNHDVDRFGP